MSARRLSPDEIVEQMRKNIDIELVHGTDNRISAFNVYYTAGNPLIAQQVTSKLTNLFINENLEVRQQESEGNTKFLENQLDATRQGLEAQEEKIREFKAQHVGELPSQLGSNLQILRWTADATAGGIRRPQHEPSSSGFIWRRCLSQYRALKGPSKDPDAPQMGLAETDRKT